MDLFDILGPIMVGPSSSHTAGAARIGYMARTLLGTRPRRAAIHLHGSFAETGLGHGTDLAIIGGLLGVALGLGLSLILSRVMGTDFHISYGAIALGVGFSAAVGILFGWAPARKASRLNPIDALRSM